MSEERTGKRVSAVRSGGAGVAPGVVARHLDKFNKRTVKKAN
jgi:hypothetical protein